MEVSLVRMKGAKPFMTTALILRRRIELMLSLPLYDLGSIALQRGQCQAGSTGTPQRPLWQAQPGSQGQQDEPSHGDQRCRWMWQVPTAILRLPRHRSGQDGTRTCSLANTIAH